MNSRSLKTSPKDEYVFTMKNGERLVGTVDKVTDEYVIVDETFYLLEMVVLNHEDIESVTYR